jgi:hypothetical protein
MRFAFLKQARQQKIQLLSAALSSTGKQYFTATENKDA